MREITKTLSSICPSLGCVQLVGHGYDVVDPGLCRKFVRVFKVERFEKGAEGEVRVRLEMCVELERWNI